MNKILYRSRTDRMIGGVASGLAKYFNIDPTIIRVLFVLTVLLGGGGILAYIILWIIVPEEPIVFNMPGGFDSSVSQSSAQQNFSQGSSEQDTVNNSATTNSPDFSTFNPQVKSESKTYIFGIILIIFGLLILLNNFIPRFDLLNFWPLILIGLGISILVSSKN
jgi:phage shock protein PspC (stress-responsive transcriptional regulator)